MEVPEDTNTDTTTREKVTVITSAVAKEKYPVRKGYKTANGGTVRDSGDDVAVALRGKDINYWLQLAEANGRRDDLQKVADAHPSNLGMVRMALGTILRAAIKRHNEAEDKEKYPYPVLSLGGETVENPPPQPAQPNDGDDDDDEDEEIAEEDDSEEADPDQPESSNAV